PQLGTLGNVAQPVEVDVGPRVDAHQYLAGGAIALDVLLDPGNGQCAGGLGDRAGVVVDILDRRTELVGAHGDHFIDMVLADIEAVVADLRYRHTVGEEPDLGQHYPLAGGQRLLQ